MADPLIKRLCRHCGEPSHRTEGRFVCLHCGTNNQVNRAEIGERSKVIPLRDLKRERHLHVVTAEPENDRPRTRADCINGPRPCPLVGCRHHLGLEVTRAGGLKPTFPHIEPDELEPSCALDLADNGSRSLEEIGELLNLTRERTRQIFETALHKIRLAGRNLKEFL